MSEIIIKENQETFIITINEINLKGDKGDQGIQGIQGIQGEDGEVTEASIKTALGITVLSGENTGDEDLTPYETITNNDAKLALKVNKVAGERLINATEIVKLGNQSNVNTGNETLVTIQSKRPLKTIEGQSIEGSGNIDISKSDVGLSNVDNTTDLLKPISTATQTALNLKISGSGTTNYIPKFTASGTVGNSSIFDNGNIGIGTTSPLSISHIKANIAETAGIKNILTIDSETGLAEVSPSNPYSLDRPSHGIGFRRVFTLNRESKLGGVYMYGVTGWKSGMFFMVKNNDSQSGDPDVKALDLLNTGAAIFYSTVSAEPATASNHLVTKAQLDSKANLASPTFTGNIASTGFMKSGQFTTATEPAYVKGAQFFNTTLNKMRIGGATAYETVTSS
jgi:hypothetical protein